MRVQQRLDRQAITPVQILGDDQHWTARQGAPQQIDPDLLLAAVTRSGTRVTYDFVLNSPDATSLDAAYRASVKQGMCDALMRYLTAGATATIAYRRTDGTPIETMALTVTECTA